MTNQLHDTLHRAAAEPNQPLNLERLLARSRRTRQRAAVAACSLLVAAITVTAVLLAPQLGNQPPDQPASGIQLDDLPTGWSHLPAPPQLRHQAATAWTGRQLLMWGGTAPGYSSTAADTGYRFDTHTGRWHTMAPSPLAPRIGPAAAWTGRKLLIWGGTTGSGTRRYSDGAAYNPEHDTWRPLPPAPISARAPLSVWTGHELIVWGSTQRGPDQPTDGAAYHPDTDIWRSISNAPITLTDATAAWTGHEMIVFGAALDHLNTPTTPTAIGAAYHPESDTWRRLPDSTLSPQASTTTWNGHHLIAADGNGTTAAYHPTTDQWSPLPDLPRDPGECRPTSAPINALVLVHACRTVTLYNPADGRWHDITHDGAAGWWVEAIPAESAAILLAKDVSSGQDAVLVHRPAW
jgi:N-acetylneuraminic acid mutarotase